MPTMSVVGLVLIAAAIAAFVIWVIQNGKAGKIKTVPFKKPSEIAQQGANAADAKQMVSTEGQVAGQPIAAPMSGMACLYYELQVTRGYHTQSRNAQGQTTKSHGTKTVLERKEGTIFNLTDGAGAVAVDCTKAPAMDLKQAHRNRINQGIVPRAVQFGSVVVEVEGLASSVAGALLGGETTDYYEGVEMIVPFVQGQKLYATKGCLACHTTTGAPGVGPTWKGIWGKQEPTNVGDVKVDENYLRESILDPQAKIVKGFGPVMPTFRGQISDAEIGEVIAYIQSLK